MRARKQRCGLQSVVALSLVLFAAGCGSSSAASKADDQPAVVQQRGPESTINKKFPKEVPLPSGKPTASTYTREATSTTYQLVFSVDDIFATVDAEKAGLKKAGYTIESESASQDAAHPNSTVVAKKGTSTVIVSGQPTADAKEVDVTVSVGA